tara:strand:- start:1298 stop:1546 length:249 start_codon:yes stop_codon:yes gene_type:complete
MKCQKARELTDLKREGQLKRNQSVAKNREGITLTTELVGIKNLKSTGVYRLEFDVFEIDTHKVKDLIDKLNKAYMMALVEYE